ncbi:hypothetical protein [Candidatus Mycobacterium methanotrophicum]|uniref:hypothetical protein n=1 Tax=Candidatus Mycobacterium methanotrophicum TaxID=2943498 RepID=UPI001C593395|nr:hypothetical protein [Candidatus Mycobacterium methanotrophicum]
MSRLEIAVFSAAHHPGLGKVPQGKTRLSFPVSEMGSRRSNPPDSGNHVSLVDTASADELETMIRLRLTRFQATGDVGLRRTADAMS